LDPAAMTQDTTDERRRRARRAALVLLGVALAIYAAFIFMSVHLAHK
jgi:hypothetical protein